MTDRLGREGPRQGEGVDMRAGSRAGRAAGALAATPRGGGRGEVAAVALSGSPAKIVGSETPHEAPERRAERRDAHDGLLEDVRLSHACESHLQQL